MSKPPTADTSWDDEVIVKLKGIHRTDGVWMSYDAIAEKIRAAEQAAREQLAREAEPNMCEQCKCRLWNAVAKLDEEEK